MKYYLSLFRSRTIQILALLGLALVILWIIANRYEKDRTDHAQSASIQEAFQVRDQLTLLKNAPETKENLEAKARLEVRLLQLAMAAENEGTIELTGEIVGDDGIPLKGVTLGVVKAIAIPGDKSWDKHEKLTIDGPLKLKYSGYCSIRLLFQKPGYRDLDLFLPLEPLDYRAKVLAPYRVVGADGKPQVRIVLEKLRQEPTTHLEEIVAKLEVNIDGAGSVLEFGRKNPLPYGSDIPVKNLTDLSSLPPHALWIQVAREEGKIAITYDPQDRGHAERLFKQLTFTFTDPKDGLILAAGKGDGVSVRNMRTAPSEGYQQQLVLTTAQTRITDYPTFYFKVDGKYGKARVNVIGGWQKQVEVVVQCYVQLDGTTNLDSAECP